MIETSTNSSFFYIFDIDGVIRDVSGSYRRVLADTVEHFTNDENRPTSEKIDELKSEGIWNNDWEAAQELIKEYFNGLGQASPISYEAIIDFFQSRYWGSDRQKMNGYIATESLIATTEYFHELTASGIGWGFFSGASRASASYVLQRLSIDDPVLVAMEDAAGKPDPTGLLLAVKQLEQQGKSAIAVVYVGDTVADMLTVVKARVYDACYKYIAVGVIPPHVQDHLRDRYASSLKESGADIVLDSVLELTPQLDLLQFI